MIKQEFCCNCDDETGKAGRGEDSIYATLIRDWHWIRGIRTEVITESGEEVGPLCESCYEKMRCDGYFETQEQEEPQPGNEYNHTFEEKSCRQRAK